jgi:hypothetical protein
MYSPTAPASLIPVEIRRIVDREWKLKIKDMILDIIMISYNRLTWNLQFLQTETLVHTYKKASNYGIVKVR